MNQWVQIGMTVDASNRVVRILVNKLVVVEATGNGQDQNCAARSIEYANPYFSLFGVRSFSKGTGQSINERLYRNMELLLTFKYRDLCIGMIR